MLTTVLGIDIAQDHFDVCLLHDDQARARGRFVNRPSGFAAFHRWVRKHKVGQPALCMEATNRYWEALATFAHAHAYPVYVVNPAQAHAFILSFNDQKDDPGDALRLAYLAASRPLHAWNPPPPHRRELRALVRRRDDLIKMRQQERNRQATADAPIVPMLEGHITFLDAQIKAVEAQIRDHINRYPDLKEDVELVDSIKGFGFISAAMIVGELLDYTRFDSADALAAYAGLVPRRRHSGTKQPPARLSKRGNALLRRALYYPALSAGCHNPLLVDQKARLLARGRSKMQAVAAGMRKLLVLAFGVLKSRQPFSADFALAGPLTA